MDRISRQVRYGIDLYPITCVANRNADAYMKPKSQVVLRWSTHADQTRIPLSIPAMALNGLQYTVGHADPGYR